MECLESSSRKSVSGRSSLWPLVSEWRGSMAWPAHKEIGCSTPPPKSLRILNLLTYILLIFVNVASQTGLFGPDNATISRRFSTPLTPAGCGQALSCDLHHLA